MWTDEGFENFQNLSKIEGIDSVLHTPRGDLHRFNTASFLNLCHPFQPFFMVKKLLDQSTLIIWISILLFMVKIKQNMEIIYLITIHIK